MIDGLYLLGNQSFKFIICVNATGAKIFTVPCCILKELHQVVTFWFISDTEMKIKNCYILYVMVATDSWYQHISTAQNKYSARALLILSMCTLLH